MKTCIKCGSHAFNLYAEEIDQGGLCDVHYWQGRAHRAEAQPPRPVQRQPLTLNEMSAIEEKVYMQTTHKGKPSFEYAQALIRATEAAHNIGVNT